MLLMMLWMFCVDAGVDVDLDVYIDFESGVDVDVGVVEGFVDLMAV